MRRFGILVLCLSCACGGGSSPPAAPTAPLLVLRGTAADIEQKRCPSAPAAPPADCPPSTQTTDVSRVDADVRAAAFAVRGELFERERQRARATRTFGNEATGVSDQARDDALKDALVQIDARARCGDSELGQPEKIADAASDPPLVFFSGATPTDAGGVGDLATWGLLAVREGCDWKRVALDLTGSSIQRFRDPSDRRVLVQARVVDQCAEEVRAFVVNGANPEVLLTMRQSRRDMVDSGVCPDSRHVEPIESKGSLQGFRTMGCDDQGTCAVVEESYFSRAITTSSPRAGSSTSSAPRL